MSTKQTVTLRIEIGPGIPAELKAFDSGQALKAILKGLYQLVLSERINLGPEAAIIASVAGTTLRVMPLRGRNIITSPDFPATRIIEYETEVTLDPEDAIGD
jgi:hypothetical protein